MLAHQSGHDRALRPGLTGNRDILYSLGQCTARVLAAGGAVGRFLLPLPGTHLPFSEGSDPGILMNWTFHGIPLEKREKEQGGQTLYSKL